MTPRLGELLLHVEEAARRAITFVDGMSEGDFRRDERTQQAVVMSLFIVGEASARLLGAHAAFAARHADVPWTAMRGMRNRIAHGYFSLDLDAVWRTVVEDLPDLVARLPVLRADAARIGGPAPGP